MPLHAILVHHTLLRSCSIFIATKMMTSLVFMLFILLLALPGAQCHFLHNQVKRRSGITITRHSSSSQTNIQYNQRRHRHPSIAVPVAFLSIRGGSSDNDGNDIDDDFADFVSSFESELVDIRREAELEAEAELEELRRMLANQSMGVESEREEEEEEEEEDDDQSAADDNSSNDNSADEVKNNDTDEESSGEETKNTESDDDIPSMPDELDVSGGNEAISDGERTDEEMIGDEEEYDNVVHSEDESVEDLDEPVIEDAIINDLDDTSTKQLKSKKTKAKKSKSNKLASKSAKKSSSSSRSLLDHVEPLSEDEVEISESAVLSRTIEKEVETRPRGISGYLKSDLARALALLVATVIISIWMQRLQRQMEAQGI